MLYRFTFDFLLLFVGVHPRDRSLMLLILINKNWPFKHHTKYLDCNRDIIRHLRLLRLNVIVTPHLSYRRFCTIFEDFHDFSKISANCDQLIRPGTDSDLHCGADQAVARGGETDETSSSAPENL